ncbi:MAG: MFS transporter [Labilithrix sp.]|nr:MFS transporter [Labilithrix sp.]
MSRPSERAIIFCVGAVQFVNILDFMIVMPLGPDFATALGIPLSHLGYVGGSYTAAACVSGLAGAFFLDRFDRRKALSVAMLGLVLGTLGGAFARGLGTLMLARIVAGAFGGPATSLSYSIIADVIPAERRGKAMGAVMGAFSLASILGVPAGLELARTGGWRLPFIAVAVLGALLGTYAHAVLPPMFGHLAQAKKRAAGDIFALARLDVAISLALSFFVMAAGFVLIPNISAYLQYNLGYPRAQLGLLYFVGGIVSLVAMRFVGGLVDRFGAAPVATCGTVVVASVTYLGFARTPPLMPVMGIFVGFMLGMAFRNVAYNTLTTKVPKPDERARFASVQSAVQHLASALGAFASAQFLSELPNHSLVGLDDAAWASIGIGLLVPPMMFVVEGRLQKTSERS